MKKLMLLAAGIVASIFFAACSTSQQQSAADALAKLQTAVVNGCMVVQPTLQSVAALDPTIAVAATANGLFCAAAASVTVTSVQSLIATGIPAMEKAVNASMLIPANQKPIAMAALGVFQLTVTNALAIYGQATVIGTPASSVPAASAPAPASSAS
ncbi:hypothetical protein LMG28688_01636 [Paraburkholderia caffeinitolerans]|uniref:Lipoprotein n=1 Tax=Paraburkholderia caffeinitolerans TaxID=1723730 RepID=A0A6J5FMJ2_9BURK|nr:hypothetical protein [Paraburkholderia caffeinitolerans]CAB3783384.1 hypothetical protein LMG28688_01636 [Paraburkholderia caffeinitolerans]